MYRQEEEEPAEEEAEAEAAAATAGEDEFFHVNTIGACDLRSLLIILMSRLQFSAQ